MEKDTNLTAQKIIRCLNEFRRLNKHKSNNCSLTHSEIMVLFSIRSHIEEYKEGIKTSELSNKLNVASPTITQQINSLETKGLVERSMDKKDRRAVRINITEKGKKLLQKASKELQNSIGGLVEYLGEEKSNQLADLLLETYNYFSKKNKDND